MATYSTGTASPAVLTVIRRAVAKALNALRQELLLASAVHCCKLLASTCVSASPQTPAVKPGGWDGNSNNGASGHL